MHLTLPFLNKAYCVSDTPSRNLNSDQQFPFHWQPLLNVIPILARTVAIVLEGVTVHSRGKGKFKDLSRISREINQQPDSSVTDL